MKRQNVACARSIFNAAVLTATVLTATLLSSVTFLSATEINLAVLTSNQSFLNGGAFSPNSPTFGSTIAITEKIQENLDGNIFFEGDPVCGNTLSARVSYRISYLEISAGPSFGMMNKGSTKNNASVLFQPGLGIGFSVVIPGIIIAQVDTDFALPAPADTGGHVYLQKSSISAGFYLPNILCTVGINQKTNTESGNRLISMTDYGLYSEAYKKGSPFRVSLDFIYRVMDYYVMPEDPANKKLGNLVIGGGLTWAPKADLSVFILGSGALYTFSLGDPVDGLDSFLFNVGCGARFLLKK